MHNKLQYTWLGDYCEGVRPAELLVLTWGSSSVPPGTTSTIRSPPGPRRIQYYKDPSLCSHQNISLAYHAYYRTNPLSYHLCVPDTAVKSLLPSLCCRYGSNNSPAVIVFLGLQWIVSCHPCIPGRTEYSPLPSLCSWYDKNSPLPLLCFWHGSKVSPAILVFLVRQQSLPSLYCVSAWQ